MPKLQTERAKAICALFTKDIHMSAENVNAELTKRGFKGMGMGVLSAYRQAVLHKIPEPWKKSATDLRAEYSGRSGRVIAKAQASAHTATAPAEVTQSGLPKGVEQALDTLLKLLPTLGIPRIVIQKHEDGVYKATADVARVEQIVFKLS